MRVSIQIRDIKPIKALSWSVDLNAPGIICIVGRNGAGKTTFVKSLLSLSVTDIFQRTSPPHVFSDTSAILFELGEAIFEFKYDATLRGLNLRMPIPREHSRVIAAELPAPHGRRFTFFRSLSEADEEIRRAIVLRNFVVPHELISFLSGIYAGQDFSNLVEVKFSTGVCVCRLIGSSLYIREDYFSSGEYFLINLYRLIRAGSSRLIVIDEVDISLDASTQANIVGRLRDICKSSGTIIVITSHSLALMQTMDEGELFYFDSQDTETKILPVSFGVAKSLLFGFRGFDRYILTEDKMLLEFLTFTIKLYCTPLYYSHQIIYCGGGGMATGLMRKNQEFTFLGPSETVFTILDGDQEGKSQDKNVKCLPFKDVETALWEEYRSPGFPHRFEGGENMEPKRLFGHYVKNGVLSKDQLFSLVCDRRQNQLADFSQFLVHRLCRQA